MYSEEVLEHVINPRNLGQMDDADAVGTAGDPDCGDLLKIYLKIVDNIIVDVNFQVFGCPGAIATSSVYTELIKGKTLEDAMEITDADITKALNNGLPPEKLHCSNLGGKALQAAIVNYILAKDNPI